MKGHSDQKETLRFTAEFAKNAEKNLIFFVCSAVYDEIHLELTSDLDSYKKNDCKIRLADIYFLFVDPLVSHPPRFRLFGYSGRPLEAKMAT